MDLHDIDHYTDHLETAMLPTEYAQFRHEAPLVAVGASLAREAERTRLKYVASLRDLARYTMHTEEPEAVAALYAEACMLDDDLDEIRRALK